MKWKGNLWSKILSILQTVEVKGLLHIAHINLQKLWNHFSAGHEPDGKSPSVGDDFNVAKLEGKTS